MPLLSPTHVKLTPAKKRPGQLFTNHVWSNWNSRTVFLFTILQVLKYKTRSVFYLSEYSELYKLGIPHYFIIFFRLRCIYKLNCKPWVAKNKWSQQVWLNISIKNTFVKKKTIHKTLTLVWCIEERLIQAPEKTFGFRIYTQDTETTGKNIFWKGENELTFPNDKLFHGTVSVSLCCCFCSEAQYHSFLIATDEFGSDFSLR